MEYGAAVRIVVEAMGVVNCTSGRDDSRNPLTSLIFFRYDTPHPAALAGTIKRKTLDFIDVLRRTMDQEEPYSQLTGREISQMALDLRETPRPPVTVIGGGACYVQMAGETFAGIKNDPERIAGIFIEAFRTIGHDLLWSGSNFINYPAHFLGCPIKDDTADGPALVGTVIQDLKDRDSLDMTLVLENSTMQSILASHGLVAEAIGKETMLLPTHWGPLTTAARILGPEKTMMAMVTEADELLGLIRFSTELIWELADRAMSHPDILGINIAEPMASADMISVDAFRTYVKPFLQDIVQRTRAKGKHCMLHICGDTTALFDDILDVSPNCFSVEAKVDLRKAKSALGGRTCIAGNVSPAGPFLSGTPAEVIAEAQACLKAWGNDKGYVLTLGCDFTKDVPLENILALMSLKNAT